MAAEATEETEETPWTDRGGERFVRVNRQHEYEKRHFVSRRIPAGRHLLDIGCGNQLLRSHHYGPYTGLDFEAGMDPDIVADSTDIPLDDGEVDVAVCKDHLVHVPDWEATVAEARRVAAERVVLMERSWGYPTTVLQDEPFRFQSFNVEDLREALAPDEPDAVQLEEFHPSTNVTMIEGTSVVYFYDR